MHLADEGGSPITLNSTISGLKFYFDITLSRGELMAKMQPVCVPRTLPVVLSRREVSRVAAEVLLIIAADPKHLGARIGATLVLHTRGSALTLQPHVHGIVPGGGLASDGKNWVACRPGFFLPVRVCRLFRRRFLEELLRLHQAGKLQIFGEHAPLSDAQALKAWLTLLRQCEWVVYAKRPFAGPQAVLACLSRYTHRVAISNSRLLALHERGVTFKWKDCRVKADAKGQTRHKTMTLAPGEVMRRFLQHVLPCGLQRI